MVGHWGNWFHHSQGTSYIVQLFSLLQILCFPFEEVKDYKSEDFSDS